MRSALPVTCAWRWRPDVATLEQVVQAADPIPAIAVSLEQQVMPAIFPSSAVVFGQQIYKHAGFITSQSGGKSHLLEYRSQIVEEQDRVVAPVIADCQHRWVSKREDFEVAPADLRNFLAPADDAVRPVEQRVGIAALL